LGWSGSSVTTPKNIGRYIDRLYGELSLKRQASLQRWLLEEENRYGFRSWQLDLVEQHAQRLGIVSKATCVDQEIGARVAIQRALADCSISCITLVKTLCRFAITFPAGWTIALPSRIVELMS
jgi:hypothetical protein